MKKMTLNTLALGSSMAMALSGMAHAENLFNAEALDGGYETKAGEAKCGGDKKVDCNTAEDKDQCMANMKKGEAKCGGDKAMDEAKAGEAKCGEGKCGGDKAMDNDKASEAKCGEAKCGGDKPMDNSKSGEAKCGEGKCGGNKK